MTDFLFPILLFTAIFFVLYAFTQHKFFSLFSAHVTMLFPQLPTLVPPSSFTELKTMLFQFTPSIGVPASELNFLGRDSFIPSAPFFVFMFYFVYQALSSKERKKWYIILGGIFYGLLFYLYFYFWVFATIFLGVLFLVFLFARNHQAVKTVLYVGALGLVVSVPFWINQYYLAQLPSYGDIVARMGVEEGHGIRWFLWKTYLLLFLMAGIAVWVGRRFSKEVLGYFLAALALTGIIAYNANVVVGWTLQSDHWGNKVFLITNGIAWPPILYYGWQYLAPFFKRKYVFNEKRIFSVIAIVVVTLLTTHVAESSIKESIKHVSYYTVPEGLMDAYEWLTKNTPKESVVVTPSIETNIELAAYTHNRIFQARAQNNLLSKAEVLDRLYITYQFFGVSPEKFFEVITSPLGVFNFFTAEYNSKALDSSLRPDKYSIYQLPQEVAKNVLNEYTHFTMPEKIPYRFDYVFVGPREKEANRKIFLPGIQELVYQKDGVEIYKLMALE